MQLITFDPLRTLHLAGVTYVKPELAFSRAGELKQADWLLFPPYWLVNTLIYSLKSRIFPSAASYHLGHDKIEMTRALKTTFPSHIPETHILPNSEFGRRQALDQLDFPFVAKHPRSSMGQGVYLIENREQFNSYCLSGQPLYLQEYLPIDRDLRLVWVGDQVVAGYWRRGEGFHNNISKGAQAVLDDIPAAAIGLVQTVARALAINYAGFDIALVNGHCYILEFNVLFGNQVLNRYDIRIEPYILRYLESQLGLPPQGIAA
ncbi:MAG: hypothetical protein OEY67_10280 [Gammaproteobacteria bacterium]|nr:hypothetical protein [Gammaproteobacteria bacterium]